MQGCPLRCACCHNPDTWDRAGGKELEAREVFDKIYRLRSYFGNEGGVTASGGEPLMQAEFLTELFTLCKNAGISTALDTSGCVYNEKVEELLGLTDIVLLDYKYTNEEDYIKYVGMSKDRVNDFLERLQTLGKRVWIRHVVIPGLNDSEESVDMIYALAEKYTCIEKTELLPFRKLCLEKYRSLCVDFPLENTPEASEELMVRLKKDR
jgi:pyruvate formate lyase activating enzyme